VTHDRELVAVGLDHTTAGIGLRERVAFADADIRSALARLAGPAGQPLEQAAILSTCNRVELYGVVRSRLRPDELAALLAQHHRLDPDELMDALYVHRGDDVAHHLAATAAGMHSLVLGEAQIQGQVRTALEHALTAGTAGPELRRLFESAIAAGRRVRSRTRLGRGVAGVPQASVELARQRLGTLAGTAVLLIGAGRVAQLAARHLAKDGVRELLVCGRDAARAERLAAQHGGHAVTSDRLREALARADVVISATGAPGAVVHADDLAGRGGAQLLLIDLALPRDIDPAVAELAGVEVLALDDLRVLVEGTLRQRRAELPAAYAVLRSEVTRFTTWLGRREPALACH
jgi:glutamyl-tRNA reductase